MDWLLFACEFALIWHIWFDKFYNKIEQNRPLCYAGRTVTVARGRGRESASVFERLVPCAPTQRKLTAPLPRVEFSFSLSFSSVAGKLLIQWVCARNLYTATFSRKKSLNLHFYCNDRALVRKKSDRKQCASVCHVKWKKLWKEWKK